MQPRRAPFERRPGGHEELGRKAAQGRVARGGAGLREPGAVGPSWPLEAFKKRKRRRQGEKIRL